MNHFCGIRLSTVGVAVGWVNFIGAIFSSILLIVAFTQLDEVVKMIEDEMNDTSYSSSIRTSVITVLCIYLTVSLANVFASAMLIVGTVKERHLLLAPWLITAYIFLFFNVLYYIYMIYMAVITSAPIAPVIIGIVTGGLSLAVLCTIWNAIFELFKQIRNNRDMQQRLLPTSSNPSYTNYTKMPTTY